MAAQNIECTTACTVTLMLEAAPPDSEKLSDILLVFALMFIAFIGVWGGRKLLEVFNTGPHDGS